MKRYYIILKNWLNESSPYDKLMIYEISPKALSKENSHGFSNVSFLDIETIDDFKPDFGAQIIAVIPGEFVNNYHLEIPVRKKKDLLNAVGFSLEDEVAEKISDVQWSITSWKPKKSVNVLTVNKTKLKDIVTWFKDKNILLDDVIPEYLLLPVHPRTTHTLAKIESNNVIIYNHKQQLGFTLDEELFDLWWNDEQNRLFPFAVNDEEFAKLLKQHDGRDINLWEIGHSIEEWLRYVNLNTNRSHEAIFLKGDLAKPKGVEEEERIYLRKAFASILIAGFLYIGILTFNNVYYFVQNKITINDLNQQFNTIFGEDVFKSDEDPWIQIRQQIALLKGAPEQESDFFKMLTSISPIMREYQQTLANLEFDGQTLIAKTQVSNFEDLDKVVKTFREINSDFKIEISESESIEGKVNGTYNIDYLNN